VFDAQKADHAGLEFNTALLQQNTGSARAGAGRHVQDNVTNEVEPITYCPGRWQIAPARNKWLPLILHKPALVQWR